MPRTVLACTDGSEASIGALKAGLRVVDPADVVLVTAVEPPDPTLVTGAGHAGGTMTPDEFDALGHRLLTEGEATLAQAQAALGLDHAETRIVRGAPGPALVGLADELGADAIVIGTRGRGGIKRALLGSVSDHVVRNAGCPVVVTGGPPGDRR